MQYFKKQMGIIMNLIFDALIWNFEIYVRYMHWI